MLKPSKSLAAFNFVVACMTVTHGYGAITTGTADSISKPPSNPSVSQVEAPEPAPLFQTHYANRVGSFKQQNLVYQNVVLLGDSITEGFDVTKYLPGKRVLNRGIGGDVIGNSLLPKDKRGILKRLDESVFDCSPTDVFILIGINDLGQGHSPETIKLGYRELLGKIRQRLPEVRLHVQSVVPTRGRYAKHNVNVRDLNVRLQTLASEFKCSFVDLHKQFADENGELKQELTKDGLHLVPTAYKQWAEIINEKLDWK